MAVAANKLPAPDLLRPRRALISVSDKSGLVELARALADAGIELLSTGGTGKALQAGGLDVRDVADLTGYPEILDGRVKTLHPAVHAGLLAIRDDEIHSEEMADLEIEPIDLAIVNLYPFEEVRAAGGSDADIVENIDIGGPAMIRAAAKNHAYVAIVTDPSDYDELLAKLKEFDGELPLAYRRELAARAFARTAAYDAGISGWFADLLDLEAPKWCAFGGTLSSVLRYGENPHQTAAFYTTGEKRTGVIGARQVQGKQLSYNNIADTDAAFELVSEFAPDVAPAAVIVKHGNPCGVAVGETQVEAYRKALACDPVSAFGGIVALNRALEAETARELVEIFTEVVIAPDATPWAREILSTRRNVRLLLTGDMPDPRQPGTLLRSISGGLLVQSRDNSVVDDLELKVVTRREPNEREMADLLFAFRVVKHVKSNAIVYAKDGATVGIGAGQMSRVDSVRIAARKAEEAAAEAGKGDPATKGSVVASDAFFPFADGLLSAVQAGATAVIQPGGSMRDDEVIAAADDNDIAMVMTGLRHFRH